jgi:hypothetical protein
LGILIPLSYAYHVNHIWEDYFITFRHSQNLCEGKGLTYNAGDPLHGFTSPLGTLLPAACHFATGQQGYLPTLWLYRALTILAFAAGGVLLLKSLWALNPDDRISRLGVPAFYLTEVKGIEFTTDGMETGFMLFFVSWAIYLFVIGCAEHWIAVGICWAGLMWTRPDGFVYIGALAVANLIFGRAPRSEIFIASLKSALVCAVLYLPWFAGAWYYYGSPIPHTILAKSNLDSGTIGHFKGVLGDIINRYREAAAGAYLPIYHFFDSAGWIEGEEWTQKIFFTVAKWLGMFSSIYWLLPVPDRLGRMASFAFVVVCLYLSTHMWYFPWYFPPATLLGNLVLVRGVVSLCRAVARSFPDDPLYRSSLQVAGAVLLVLFVRQLGLFGFTWWQMTIQDRVIEMGHRKVIGEWLGEHVKPDESVYLEPFGYIGYFSGARIIDWPGLVAPEVVRLRREKKFNMGEVARELLPDWMVLRPFEADGISQAPFFDEYALMKKFDAEPELRKYKRIPGPNWLRFDAKLNVYKRMKSDEIRSSFMEIPFSITPTRVLTPDTSPIMVFVLPKPTRVSAIRLRFTYEGAREPVPFAFGWKGASTPGHDGEHSVNWLQRTGDAELTRLIWIDDVVELFRITPDNKPSKFKLKEITLLEPRTN